MCSITQNVILHFQLASLKKMHLAMSPNHLEQHVEQVKISLDGVKEFNSGGQSLEVLCVQFPPCRHVYHISVWKKDKPLTDAENAKVDELEPLRELLAEVIKECPRQVSMMCLDAPKRSKVRGQRAATGYFACDYCLAPGEQYVLPSGKKQPRWPFSQCYDKPLRTNEASRDVANPPPGIDHESPLLVLESEGFDIVHSVPADSMHTVAGVVKRLFEMCFSLKNATTRHVAPPGIRRMSEEHLKGLTWNVLVSNELEELHAAMHMC